jgi:hypothetical protein
MMVKGYSDVPIAILLLCPSTGMLPTSHWDSSHLQWHLPGAIFSVGRAPSGVVSNRVGRVSPIIGTAAARKIDVRFWHGCQYFLIGDEQAAALVRLNCMPASRTIERFKAQGFPLISFEKHAYHI